MSQYKQIKLIVTPNFINVLKYNFHENKQLSYVGTMYLMFI